MGGEGAKERRRLKRLAQNDDDGKPGNNSNARDVRKRKMFSKFDKPKGPPIEKKLFVKNPRSPSYKKEKINKPKKPKHLKRKLEQLGEDNGEAREEILKKIGDWEKTKGKFGSGSKRPKKERPFDPVANDVSRTSPGEEEDPISGSTPSGNTTKDSSDDNGGSGAELKPAKAGRKGKDDEEERKHEDSTSASTSSDITTKDTSDGNSSSGAKFKPAKAERESNDDEEERKPEYPTNASRPSGITTKDTSDGNGGSGAKFKSGKAKRESNDDEEARKPAKRETNAIEDSDSDGDVVEQRRQRGRRRRGRKDTAKQISEADEMNETDGKREILGDFGEKTDDGGNEKTNKRYCIGRKPLTDFKIGEKYTGRVVYVKPFGVFIDIGCHSDAFCHVSRLSDDYVESPEALFKDGDEVSPRIVEIDRRKKKITVSLQSEARMADERASLAARQQRKGSRKPASEKKPTGMLSDGEGNGHATNSPCQKEAQQPLQQDMRKESQLTETRSAPTEPRKAIFLPPDESTMTPAELKRARKLARRAARREESGETTQQ